MKEYKMIKKIFVGATIALVLFAGVFAFAKTSFAQDDATDVVAEEVETPAMEALEYENQNQNSPNSDDADAIMTQTRTRSRELVVDGECTGECDPIQQRLQDGECTGECDPIQQRLQDGSGEGSGGPQQKQNLGVDKWNATGVPQGSGPNNGASNRGGPQGSGQEMGTGDPSTCPYYNETTP
jgi:hypothetical protein